VTERPPYVPGGRRPRAGGGALTGSLTLGSLSALRFGTAVLGCCGLSASDGMTAYGLDEAAVKKAVITSARRIIAAADGGKLGRTTHAYVGPSTLVDTLVTDTTASADETRRTGWPCGTRSPGGWTPSPSSPAAVASPPSSAKASWATPRC
jgi:DeoR/GlpR family transcriptional regulator of sugar metabolism